MSRTKKSFGWAVLLSLLAIGCASGRGVGGDQSAGVRAPTPGEEPRSGHRKLAVLVGVGAYKFARPRLYGPVNDVAAMNSVLTSPAYGFKKEDVHLLTDAQATREKILEELDNYLIGKADKGAIVVFYWSG